MLKNLTGLILLSLLFVLMPAAPAQGAHSATLAWSPSSDGSANLTSGYNVLKGAASGGESATPINSSPVAVGCTSITTCTFTDTNVQAGQTLYYKVVFVVGTQSSAASNESSGTIPIAAPTGLTVTAD